MSRGIHSQKSTDPISIFGLPSGLRESCHEQRKHYHVFFQLKYDYNLKYISHNLFCQSFCYHDDDRKRPRTLPTNYCIITKGREIVAKYLGKLLNKSQALSQGSFTGKAKWPLSLPKVFPGKFSGEKSINYQFAWPPVRTRNLLLLNL